MYVVAAAVAVAVLDRVVFPLLVSVICDDEKTKLRRRKEGSKDRFRIQKERRRIDRNINQSINRRIVSYCFAC